MEEGSGWLPCGWRVLHVPQSTGPCWVSSGCCWPRWSCQATPGCAASPWCLALQPGTCCGVSAHPPSCPPCCRGLRRRQWKVKPRRAPAHAACSALHGCTLHGCISRMDPAAWMPSAVCRAGFVAPCPTLKAGPCQPPALSCGVGASGLLAPGAEGARLAAVLAAACAAPGMARVGRRSSSFRQGSQADMAQAQDRGSREPGRGSWGCMSGLKACPPCAFWH